MHIITRLVSKKDVHLGTRLRRLLSQNFTFEELSKIDEAITEIFMKGYTTKEIGGEEYILFDGEDQHMPISC